MQNLGVCLSMCHTAMFMEIEEPSASQTRIFYLDLHQNNTRRKHNCGETVGVTSLNFDAEKFALRMILS